MTSWLPSNLCVLHSITWLLHKTVFCVFSWLQLLGVLPVCRYLEHRGTVKGSAKRNAIFSERFDLIESAFYLFGFSRQVSKQI